MEKVNSELVLHNRYIMEQNKRLKKAAELLQQERQRLLSELKAQLSSSNHVGHKQAARSSSPGGSTQASSK